MYIEIHLDLRLDRANLILCYKMVSHQFDLIPVFNWPLRGFMWISLQRCRIFTSVSLSAAFISSKSLDLISHVSFLVLVNTHETKAGCRIWGSILPVITALFVGCLQQLAIRMIRENAALTDWVPRESKQNGNLLDDNIRLLRLIPLCDENGVLFLIAENIL